MAKRKTATSKATTYPSVREITQPKQSVKVTQELADEDQLNELIHQTELYLSGLPYCQQAGKGVAILVDVVPAGVNVGPGEATHAAELSFTNGRFHLAFPGNSKGKQFLSEFDISIKVQVAAKIPRLADYVVSRSETLHERMQNALQGLKSYLPEAFVTEALRGAAK